MVLIEGVRYIVSDKVVDVQLLDQELWVDWWEKRSTTIGNICAPEEDVDSAAIDMIGLPVNQVIARWPWSSSFAPKEYHNIMTDEGQYRSGKNAKICIPSMR